ncbi:RNA-binding protein 34 isoform X1 [Antechinus flavipes]|uniref:RNA-binding protein 34 isoform X1 n=2 Tax=Antechinus flavipes TaxID=38775 RepID=UPI00223567E6|nr:RNA-binding protein 34 isoform X1 [Antechinus flavipes]
MTSRAPEVDKTTWSISSGDVVLRPRWRLKGRLSGRKRNIPETAVEDKMSSSSSGEYQVGQVAGSLFQNKPCKSVKSHLASLFSSSSAQAQQPVYVAAKEANGKKRKHNEDEIVLHNQRTSAAVEQMPAKKIIMKKDLSDADKRLAHRESALVSADLEEEEEKVQTKQMKKQKISQASSNGKTANGKILDNSNYSFELNKRKKIQINEAEERIKNKRTVFVGNLPVTCKKKELKSFFKEYGQIECVRFRSLIPAKSNLSKKIAAIKREVHPEQKSINGYVVFKEESAAEKALKRNGAQIAEGFPIRVELISDTPLRGKRSVFVGNLPYKIEETAIQEHFSDCGSVLAVKIVRNKVTGIGKGCGYVLFENTDAVQLALKLNNSELMGRKLRVKRYVNNEKAKLSHTPGKVLENSTKFKHKLNFPLKNTGQHSENAFAGEKANPLKKKKKWQKSGKSKKRMEKHK